MPAPIKINSHNTNDLLNIPIDYYGVIYKITNLINNKIYIGQTTVTVKNRFRTHCACKKRYPLSNSIKKYGRENFKLETIDYCLNKEELNCREIYWIQHYNSQVPNGYNIHSGGIIMRVHSFMSQKRLKEVSKNQSLLLKKQKLDPDFEYKRKQAFLESASKTYLMISPNGTFFKINRIKEFAKQHNLGYRSIYNVFIGKIDYYKGWISAYSGPILCDMDFPIELPRKKTVLIFLSIISGKIEIGYPYQFCLKYNYNPGPVSKLINKTKKTYKNWIVAPPYIMEGI